MALTECTPPKRLSLGVALLSSYLQWSWVQLAVCTELCQAQMAN